ncbi:MAG: hypothetical protein ACJ8AH_14655, partial [Stellaceae bacterium]
MAPRLRDRYLAKTGCGGQLTVEPVPADAPANPFTTAEGDYGFSGRSSRRPESGNFARPAKHFIDLARVQLFGVDHLSGIFFDDDRA